MMICLTLDQLACDVPGCNLINDDGSWRALNPDGSTGQLPGITAASRDVTSQRC